MSENIVIRLSAEASHDVEWMLTDASGARHGAPVRGSLIAAAAVAVSRRVLVVLPSADVLITGADIPAKGAKLLQALPFALEEQLADDIDELHFAAGPRRSSGRVPVAVVKRSLFKSYLERLTNAGIKPDAVYAETQGLSRIPGTISIMIDQEDLIINDGADTELSLQQLSPGDALVAIGALDDVHDVTDDAQESRNPLPSHVLVYLSEDDNERYSNDWLALRNELDSLETKLLPDGVLPRIAATVSSGKAINLLQGEFASESGKSASTKPWRMAAALLAGVIALSFFQSVAEHFSLKRAFQRSEVRLAEQWQRTLPWINPIPNNPGNRLSAELRRMGASADSGTDQAQLLLALAALSKAIATSPDSKIDDISFSSGITVIQLTVPSTEQLDKIQSAIQADPSLDALIQQADKEKEGSGVISRLQIRGARS